MEDAIVEPQSVVWDVLGCDPRKLVLLVHVLCV